MKKKWLTLLSFLAAIIAVAGALMGTGILKPAPAATVEQATDEKTNQQQLSIAFVNEDTGTTYNGQEIALGQLFSERVIGQMPDQASLVSRSLANRGLEDGQYQLMILIPNNFSQHSMGLELEQPQQATIQYKVNPEAPLEIQQLAENTANQLIQNMNQELITIYFSSILGNLNQAQTNVLEVVQREGETLGTYSEGLMNPMNQFSNHFSGLSSVANRSKNSFTALDNNLAETNNRFTTIVGKDRNYTDELTTIIQSQTAYAENLLSQQESMTTFEEQMTGLSVEEQIAAINIRNQMIAEEFVNHPLYQNIIENSGLINTYLASLSTELMNRNEEITTYLEEEFAPNVYQVLAERLTDENNEAFTLATINEPVHEAVQQTIFKKIDELPSLNKDEITASVLTEAEKEPLYRVVDFSNQFLTRYIEEQTPLPQMKIKPGLRLDVPLQQVAIELRQTGKNVTISTTLDLDQAAQFQVEVPDKFVLTEAIVHYQNGPASRSEALSINGNKASSNKLAMEKQTGNQEVRLDLNVKLKEQASVVANETLLTTFTIQKEATKTVEGQKKSFMDQLKELFGKGTMTTTIVHAAELSDEVVPPAETEETPAVEESVEEPVEEIPIEENPTEEAPTVPVPTPETPPVTEPEEEQPELPAEEIPEPIGEPLVLTKEDTIIIRQTTQLVPDQQTLEQRVLSQTLAPYQELVALIELYYGYDVANGETVPADQVGSAGSLMALLNTDDIAESITNSLVESLVRDVRDITTTTEAVITDIAALQVNANGLAEQMTAINTMNVDLNATIEETLGEVRAVQDTLTERVPFEAIPLEETDGMVTVATAIHDDLNQLLGASEELMGQTEENKKTATGVYEVFDDLNERVTAIETEGTQLKTSSDLFINSFITTYNENLTFAENFSQVMANSQIGNRKNEPLYQYLSQPIEGTDQTVTQTPWPDEEEVAVEGATQVGNRTAFITVLVAYLVSLLTAYIFHQSGELRFGKRAFVKETLISNNLPVAFVAAGAAIVEGIVMGVIIATRLDLSGGRAVGLVFVVSVILLALVAANTWLLRQLASLGMFLSLTLFTFYLVSSNQLLLGTYSNWNETLQKVNPLHFLEKLVFHYLNDYGRWVAAFGITLVVGILFIGLNTIVKKQTSSAQPSTGE